MTPIEVLIGDCILANSNETKLALIEFGIPPCQLSLWPNPAPSTFFRSDATARPLRKLTVISNHAPPEVIEAVRLLESEHGLHCRHIGNMGEVKRIVPEDIHSSDALLTIGKSVQYGLVARVPVYCYDVFGGPGWLTDQNYERAKEFNFSGRCCGTRREPHTIAAEIAEQFQAALCFAQMVDQTALATFSQEAHLSKIIADSERAASSERMMSVFTQQHAPVILQAVRHSTLLRRESGNHARLHRKYQELQGFAIDLSRGWADTSNESYPDNTAQFVAQFLAGPDEINSPTTLAAWRLNFQEEQSIQRDITQLLLTNRQQSIHTHLARRGLHLLLDLADLGAHNVSTQAPTEITFHRGEIEFTEAATYPSMVLACPQLIWGQRTVMVIAIRADLRETDGSSMLRIYLRRAEQDFSESDCRRKKIQNGYNVFCFVTPDFRNVNAIRLDVGTSTGTYVIDLFSIAGYHKPPSVQETNPPSV